MKKIIFALLISAGISISNISAADPINLIDINVVSAEVIFESTDNEKASVTNDTDKSQVRVDIEEYDGDLFITSEKMSNMVSNAGQLIVYVPENYKIRASGMSSSFRVNSSCGKDIKIKTMSGNIRSNCIGSSQTHFESMSGSITTRAALLTGKHVLSSMSGDVNAFLASKSTGTIAAISENGTAEINAKQKKYGEIIEEIGKSDAVLVANTISGDAVIGF